jgi:MinD superfamily P-loop ATPase
VKQILILSGKGGTGKTTVSGIFARLAFPCAIADCDVDAADLHIIVSPDPYEKNIFYGGKKARINLSDCSTCGRCADICRFEAISSPPFNVKEIFCEGCGVCEWNCPAKAIELYNAVCGFWFVSRCRFGIFAGARLRPGTENSGKLVALLKKEAAKAALSEKLEYLIIDGAPGIGCPVMASLSETDIVVIVAEPTVSGRHDFERLAELLKKTDMKFFLIVNKFDINLAETENLERISENLGIKSIGRIPFDLEVVKTLTRKEVLGENFQCKASVAAEKVWLALKSEMGK